MADRFMVYFAKVCFTMAAELYMTIVKIKCYLPVRRSRVNKEGSACFTCLYFLAPQIIWDNSLSNLQATQIPANHAEDLSQLYMLVICIVRC